MFTWTMLIQGDVPMYTNPPKEEIKIEEQTRFCLSI